MNITKANGKNEYELIKNFDYNKALRENPL